VSDRSSKSRSASARSRQRRGAAPRSGTRAAPAATTGVATTLRPVRPASAALARRFTGGATPTFTLSREMEFAYIRADLRRLAIIAGSLLVLMLLILVIVER
jgi:hypothetical protein